MATIAEWRALLTAWSEALLVDEELKEDLPHEAFQSHWLGTEPASDEQILRAEERLGVQLPPSYRRFLQTTNGWGHTGHFIYRVRPAEEIDWYRVQNADSVRMALETDETLDPVSDEDYFVYGENQSSVLYRAAYLASALQISDIGDSAVYLLNPEVQLNGEWEAWFFATWLPGASRYRSFWEMMRHQYDDYIAVRAARESAEQG